MAETVEVAVVGGGQAGLALSHELSGADVEHLVLERRHVAATWSGRWDSFCLVIPNWTVRLPGGHYSGDDPDGYMSRDEIVGHLRRYAGSFNAPVREGVDVSSVRADDKGNFRLRTSSGDLLARQVVIASGGYQKPHRPSAAARIPAWLAVIDAEDYANPEALPPGPVLVVGSGQTGCQLAEELIEAGRQVFLACGRAPWIHRRLGGRDTVAWIADTTFLDSTSADLPSPAARLGANPQSSGRRGGHDLHYRTLQAQGVELLGHFIGVEDGVAHFAADLAASVAFGDARYADLCGLITRSCVERGEKAPDMPPPPAFVCDPPQSLRLGDLGVVIFTSGYRPDYASWVEFPGAFDDMGYPIQTDGSSDSVSGLHFMGMHYQRKRKSATLLGVGEDATVLAETITAQRR